MNVHVKAGIASRLTSAVLVLLFFHSLCGACGDAERAAEENARAASVVFFSVLDKRSKLGGMSPR